jgi:hypothetical protein
LRQFFGPGNRLRWEDLAAHEPPGPHLTVVRPLLDDLGHAERPALLPCRLADGRCRWYALYRSERQGRDLRERLTAFVGPTWSDFNGQAFVPDSDDPVEAAVREMLADGPFAGAFRLTTPDPGDARAAERALLLLRDMAGQQPARRAAAVRAVGRLLRDFDLALYRGDGPAAEACLGELRDRGQLSTFNLACLRVRLLAALGRWREVLALPERAALLEQRRPVQVTRALVQAVYRVHLARFEEENRPAAAVEHFRQVLQVEYGGLFRARGTLRDPDVLKASLVALASSGRPRPEGVAAVLADYPADQPGRPYLEALAGLIAPPPPEPVPDPVVRAQQAFDAGDFDTAVGLLAACPATPQTLRQLLQSAAEVNSLEAARIALAALEAAPAAVRDAVLVARLSRRLRDELLELAAGDTGAQDIPDGWLAWLERLNSRGPWSGAVAVAAAGSLEWPVRPFREDPDAVGRLADGLMAGQVSAVLRDCLPSLLSAFLPDGQAEPRFKRVYLALLELLVLDDAIGAADLPALADLAEAVLHCGLSTREHAQMVEYLDVVWARVSAPRQLSWALDVMELLASFGVGAHADVSAFVQAVLAAFARWNRRVTPEQWDLLEVLCVDLGLKEATTGYRPAAEATPEQAEQERDWGERLRGRTVAVYALNSRVVSLVANNIERRFAGVRVRVNSEKDASKALRDLAGHADIFIVNTRDAKHMATECIEQNRPAHLVTLYPQGKTANKMLEALYDWLRGEVATVA